MSCERCGLSPTPYHIVVVRGSDDKVWLACDECASVIKPRPTKFGDASMIATDDIPGGYVVKHGLVHEDGSPRTFYSKSDIKKAAYEAGWSISGDTPNPNPRIVESRQREQERKARLLRD
jgi:hypothetical protein